MVWAHPGGFLRRRLSVRDFFQALPGSSCLRSGRPILFFAMKPVFDSPPG
jgi:hypothetical protein